MKKIKKPVRVGPRTYDPDNTKDMADLEPLMQQPSVMRHLERIGAFEKESATVAATESEAEPKKAGSKAK